MALTAVALIGLLLGSGVVAAIVNQVLQGLLDSFKHKRLREKQLQEVLLKDRIEAYKELHHLLQDLVWKVNVIRQGLEILRWPKVRISPLAAQPVNDSNALEDAEKVDKRIKSLADHVNQNALVMGSEVQLIFWEHYSTVKRWRAFVDTHTNGEIFNRVPLAQKYILEAFVNLYERTVDAMTRDLRVQGFELVSNEQVDEVVKRAFDRFDQTVGPSS